jgi:hypothetical protein
MSAQQNQMQLSRSTINQVNNAITRQQAPLLPLTSERPNPLVKKLFEENTLSSHTDIGTSKSQEYIKSKLEQHISQQ